MKKFISLKLIVFSFILVAGSVSFSAPGIHAGTGTDSIIAVSYTHLDVYKRQSYNYCYLFIHSHFHSPNYSVIFSSFSFTNSSVKYPPETISLNAHSTVILSG